MPNISSIDMKRNILLPRTDYEEIMHQANDTILNKLHVHKTSQCVQMGSRPPLYCAGYSVFAAASSRLRNTAISTRQTISIAFRREICSPRMLSSKRVRMRAGVDVIDATIILFFIFNRFWYLRSPEDHRLSGVSFLNMYLMRKSFNLPIVGVHDKVSRKTERGITALWDCFENISDIFSQLFSIVIYLWYTKARGFKTTFSHYLRWDTEQLY